MKQESDASPSASLSSPLDRRQLLRQTGIASAGAVAAGLLATTFARAAAAASATPGQVEGPFYPVKDQPDKDADMTKVQGHNLSAEGQVVVIRGRVVDATTGQAIAGGMVEFWQACATGKYDHPDDPNDAALDPNFQYWAQVLTDVNGGFMLKTIKPGAYQASETWRRPPHIHVKVHKTGYPSLTTQLYFKGDPLNGKDLILQKVPRALQNLVVVDFKQSRSQLTGEWTIYLQKFQRSNVRRPVTVTPELD